MNIKNGILLAILGGVVALLISIGQVAMAAPDNPLRMQTRTHWPLNIHTVGDAAQYLLEPTGFKLLLGGTAPREARAIAARTIAPEAISPRTLAIEEALLAIAGPNTRLIVDTEHQLVTFGYAISQEGS